MINNGPINVEENVLKALFAARINSLDPGCNATASQICFTANPNNCEITAKWRAAGATVCFHNDQVRDALHHGINMVGGATATLTLDVIEQGVEGEFTCMLPYTEVIQRLRTILATHRYSSGWSQHRL